MKINLSIEELHFLQGVLEHELEECDIADAMEFGELFQSVLDKLKKANDKRRRKMEKIKMEVENENN